MTELNSSLTVLVSTVTQMYDIFAACDSVYLVIPLAEISYNSAVYNESYTKKLIIAHRINIHFILNVPCSFTCYRFLYRGPSYTN